MYFSYILDTQWLEVLTSNIRKIYSILNILSKKMKEGKCFNFFVEYLLIKKDKKI